MDLLWVLHLNFHFETWHDNLRDSSRLLTRWDNSKTRKRMNEHVLKYVGLRWSIFLIGHLHFNGKVDVPNSVTYLRRTLIFEWYVVWCGSKNKYQKDTCLKEIGLHAQNMITIVASIIDLLGGNLYDHSMSTRIFTLILNKIYVWAPKIMATTSIWIR